MGLLGKAVWKFLYNQNTLLFQGHNKSITAIAISSDRSRLYSAGSDAISAVAHIYILYCCVLIFIRPFEKTGRIMGTRAAGGQRPEHFPLNNFNSFHCIIIKLCEHVCWQNILAKFDNQPDPMKHFGVMALELANIAKISYFFNKSHYFPF